MRTNRRLFLLKSLLTQEPLDEVRGTGPYEVADGKYNSADAGLGFDPLCEIGDAATQAGVFEPQLDGTLDVSKYKVPVALRAKRAAFLGAHYAGIPLFAFLHALAFGWGPTAIGIATAGVVALARRVTGNVNAASSAFVPDGTTEADLLFVYLDLVQLKCDDSLDEKGLAALENRVQPLHAFMDWIVGATQVLVNRAGFDGYRAPRIWFNDPSLDPYAAHSSTGDLDRASNVYVGVGFLLRPLGETLAMMTHELGHLFHGDYGPLRDSFRLNPNGVGFRRGMAWATGVTTVSAIAAAAFYALKSILQGALAGLNPVSVANSVGWIAAAFLIAAIALIAGFGATRQEELRADHFAAWLTHPQWWISWLRMRQASRDWGRDHSPDAKTALERFWDRRMSTHPDYDKRIDALESFKANCVMRDIPALPASDSIHSLNGETTIVLSDMDAGVLEALQAGLEGQFEAQVYSVENDDEPTGLVRVHRADWAQLDRTIDSEAVSAIRAAAKACPSVKVVSFASKPHEVFRWAAKSRTARTALRVLKESRVSIRWDTKLGPEDPRGTFRPDGDDGPEILVNASIFLASSPKALLALISREAYHAAVWARMCEIGVDGLNLDSLEFERFAHAIGLRVFAELRGTEIDDVDDAIGEPAYMGALREWNAFDEDEQIEYLIANGCSEFTRLRDLREMAPEVLVAEIGIEGTPAVIAGKIEALWNFYEAERKGESHFWFLTRWFMKSSSRLRLQASR